MSWNYRVIDHGTHLALHEVYYTKGGAVDCWTKEPVGFVADPERGLADLVWQLERALADARERGVLRVRGDVLLG